MIRTVPACPLVYWPEDKEPRFEDLSDAVDRLPTTFWPLVRGLVFRPARKGIRRWQPLDGQRAVLDDMRERLDEQGLGPAVLTTASGCPGGIRAGAMAIHGIPG